MNTIVVARWNEPLAWTAIIPPDWSLRIVQKDMDLPNKGREPSSYLWAIIDLYRRLRTRDVVAFVQGDPFAHTHDLVAQLKQPTTGFRPLIGDARYGTTRLTSDADGDPHDRGTPVGYWYETWLEQPFPGQVHFWPGGQFAVTGRAIRARPVRFYRRVYTDVMTENDRTPYVLERLWPAIFGNG